MTVGLRQGSVVTEIGPGGILHSFFSTVAVRLEASRWGDRFPVLMKKLYGGSIALEDADVATDEIAQIKAELSGLSPDSVIWDADDLTKQPPWGRELQPHVRSCADYWITTSARNLIDEIVDNLESLREFGGTLDVISYEGVPRP